MFFENKSHFANVINDISLILEYYAKIIDILDTKGDDMQNYDNKEGLEYLRIVSLSAFSKIDYILSKCYKEETNDKAFVSEVLESTKAVDESSDE